MVHYRLKSMSEYSYLNNKANRNIFKKIMHFIIKKQYYGRVFVTSSIIS